uniref:Arsenate reductase n=1 Tax=Magnetococcus massalia (strain MO-1) TaxID=451514 RepID=A0A1S7LNC3_MAGMO|nr:putative arsenate reductase (arsC) [Candidatus Magnetococcus massalia]
MAVTIYHNPRCSKSRQTLSLLEERALDIDIVEYLKTPLDRAGLQDLLNKLGKKPREVIRTGEAIYKELGLKDPTISDDELLDQMVANPKLIERPIVVVEDRAALGRPPTQVLDLFDDE